MNAPRILFLANDPFLAACHGEALARAGFHVHIVLDGDSAVRWLEENETSVLVIDLLLPRENTAEIISRIRAQKALRMLPIIALPTELESLSQAAHLAGATKQLERFANPVAALVKAVELLFETQDSHSHTETPHAGPEWLERCQAEMPVRLNRLRQSLQHTRQVPNGTPGLFRELLQDLHHFCELNALLERKPVFQLASALESLVFDLDTLPEQATLSTVRTVGQGIDFLDTLMNEDRWARTRPLQETGVLIVDDEPSARQLITVAMQLVQLPATAAATPEATLQIVQHTPFDLIFLDVGLPGMNGFELCLKIRDIAAHHDTPIVFLTGMATFQNRVQSSLSGGNDFIGKPFNIPELGVKALLWAFKGQLNEPVSA